MRAIKPGSDEQRGQYAEESSHGGKHTLLRIGFVELLLLRHGIFERHIRIKAGDRFAHLRQHRRRRAAGAHLDVHGAKRSFLHLGVVSHRPRLFIHSVVLAVADHADDGGSVLPLAKLMAQRIGVGEVSLHEGLIDQRDMLCFRCIGFGDVAAGENRNAHGVKEARSNPIRPQRFTAFFDAIERQTVIVGPS